MRTGGVYDAHSAKKTGGEDRYMKQKLTIDPATDMDMDMDMDTYPYPWSQSTF